MGMNLGLVVGKREVTAWGAQKARDPVTRKVAGATFF